MNTVQKIIDFIKNLKIINGKGQITPFILWDCQKKFIQAAVENKYVAVLKARQLGFTWTSAAFALYEILNQEYATVLYLSYKEEMGRDFLKKVKFLERNLPKEMQISGKKINRSCEFGSEETQSRIIVLPSGENQGAGFSSVNLVIMDEWARHPHDEEVFQSIYPTLSNNENGKLIGISTPEHAGNLFHEIWIKNKGFYKLAFDWHHHPYRNEDWKKKEILRIGEKRFARQYELRFTFSGDPVFDSAYIKAQGTRQNPKPGGIYYIGVDTASGSLEGDFSSLCVLEYRDKWFYQVFSYAAREPISVFSQKLTRTIKAFQPRAVVIEENNTGHAVLEKIYENIQPEIIHPFNMNSASKPMVISELEEGLRTHQIHLYCEKTISELLAYSYDKKGGMNATAGMHDDRVIALALAFEARKYVTYQSGEVVTFL